jgi:hypothetical protein
MLAQRHRRLFCLVRRAGRQSREPNARKFAEQLPHKQPAPQAHRLRFPAIPCAAKLAARR